ncbi:MAG: sodium/proton-translocating pyrophosphatase, partial [Bacilli bacterium]|nr:sodium/proton-translocating pyrophosphatase [Bacilli bacterium]
MGLLNSFTMVIIVTVVSLLGLAYAFFLKNKVDKVKVEDKKMAEIQSYIREGAMAFLKREYKTLGIFIVVLFIVIAIAVSPLTAVCFLLGAILSGTAGFIGMRSATSANAKTAQAAAKGGINKALSMAFSGGAITGLCVVSLGLGGLSLMLYLLNFLPSINADFVKLTDIVTGFGLGASSIALFSRVGGGIYTKAADVG